MSKKRSLPVITPSAPQSPLAVVNADTATFECVFPTCDGLCCHQSRPPVEPAEAARITKVLPRVLGAMRPSARRKVEKFGFLTARIKSKRRMIAIDDRYCVFYNQGCVLHRLGGAEGDTTKYKPWVCTAFPLDTDAKGRWEVRQWGRKGEEWDLFCLDPKESKKKAVKTLAFEIDFVASLEGPKQRWRFAK